MSISAEQWRVVIGCNSVRRTCQIDLKQCILEKIVFGEGEVYFAQEMLNRDLSNNSRLSSNSIQDGNNYHISITYNYY